MVTNVPGTEISGRIGNSILLVRVSPLTGETNEMLINCTPEEYANWKFNRVLIQEAMPRASADEREFCMTGYTPEDWEKLFGED